MHPDTGNGPHVMFHSTQTCIIKSFSVILQNVKAGTVHLKMKMLSSFTYPLNLYDFLSYKELKGIVHPKMKLMLLIIHPHVIPNTRPSFIFRTQIKIFLMKSESFLILHRQQCNVVVLSWMMVDGDAEDKNYWIKSLFLFSLHTYWFGMTWGWVITDRIFIFGWTIPLNVVWERAAWTFFNASPFLVHGRQKVLHVCSDMKGSKWGQFSFFAWTMPLSSVKVWVGFENTSLLSTLSRFESPSVPSEWKSELICDAVL